MSDKEKLAQWVIQRGYATGHGDTIEDLLQELEWQIAEKRGPVTFVWLFKKLRYSSKNLQVPFSLM